MEHTSNFFRLTTQDCQKKRFGLRAEDRKETHTKNFQGTFISILNWCLWCPFQTIIDSRYIIVNVLNQKFGMDLFVVPVKKH